MLCVIAYIAGSCLIPPLLKNSAVSDTAIQQTSGTTERVCVIDDNNEALLWRLRMIQEARQEIVLVTFELRDDVSGRAIMAALLEAAERGVTVRVLIDGIDGELRLHNSQNFDAFLSHENIEVKFYNPLRITALWKVNYRLHDKYLIIDDTAYLLGGRNTHDVYLGNFSDEAQADRDVVVYETVPSEFSSLGGLRDYFEATWNLEECVLLSGSMDRQAQERIWTELKEQLTEIISDSEYQITPIDWDRETIKADSVMLLTGSPEAWNKEPVLWEQLCRLMENADDVMIQTPLIICDKSMLSDLAQICESANSVEIITNAPESNVNLLAAGYPYQKSKVLELGVGITESCENKAMHTKTFLIDDSISVIGSYNLDARSTYIDTELMLVIDCPALNADLREQMADTKSQSRLIASDGSVSYGAMYVPVEMPFSRKCRNAVLGVILFPFQYLL